MVYGDFQAFQNMLPCFRRLQLKLAAPLDDNLAMFDKFFEDSLQGKCLGSIINKSYHIGRKYGLHLGIFVQLVEDFFRYGSPFQFDDDADAVAVRFIAQISNVGDFLILDELRNFCNHERFIHLVRNFGDNNGVPA